MTELSPAILTNDISDFRKKYAELFALSHYFKKVHVDFIDDIFIRNKTVMPKDLPFLKTSPLTLIAHFMTVEPQKYFQDAKDAGFTWVIFHYEAFTNESGIDEAIQAARNLQLKVGLAVNPETPIYMAGKFISKIDMIQLMGVHPGFQGRPFMIATVDKVRELRSLSKTVIIAVDGGVKIGIAHQLAAMGANIIVAGSSIFRGEDEQMAVEALKADIEV
jgi:ribulose-phosphate 3-epimerase